MIEFVEVCTYSINSNYKGYDIPLEFTSLEYHSFRSIENQKKRTFDMAEMKDILTKINGMPYCMIYSIAFDYLRSYEKR